ncbi:unnamed protein product [Adineta ricciae]|uniref:Uncharacterized protein n=1 Tax=Adineta ricciae TaxID=249248 RepID=A0A815ZP50_ADIRI|nr:unnamed protein product [Adineta ricciae]CAF1585962.1 unnamed protein product [Adineta ricciae]
MLIRRQPKYPNKYKYASILVLVMCFIVSTIYTTQAYLYINPGIKILKSGFHFVTFSIGICRPYVAPDNRPFYERDYPQENLPRRLSNSSYENVVRQLHSFRLVILSCARNVASHVDRFRSRTEAILDLFHPSSSVHVLESDSSDGTAETLRRWSRVQVYSYGRLARKYHERTERLAYCRNTLFEKVYNLTVDYFLIVDFDRFSTTVASFLTNFQYDTDDWSVMTASTADAYYDIWALRTLSDTIVNYDVWHRVWDLEVSPNNYCRQSVTEQIIGIHNKRIPIERGLIEVRSAFGGAGLYKANVTRKCQYNGKGPTCEHVPFHLCIRKTYQGRIFINPAFLVS